jgi:D-sedoheptulose 7-phosphate isomerase
VGRFRRVRRPLKAMALTANTSILTALGNDFGFEEIYSRQVKAFADQGDVVVAISTSGKSRDVLRGVEEARRCGATTIGFTGSSGGELARICDHVVQIPSEDVQRIQECHILVAHIVCELIERVVVERE